MHAPMAAELRQRGQRPSEATNEGGYFAGGVGGGSLGDGGGNQTPQQQRQNSQNSHGGSATAGGYCQYGTPQQPAAATPNHQVGGYGNYTPQQPVQQQSSYPNTAPPAYGHQQPQQMHQQNAVGYNNNQSSSPQINLHATGYQGPSGYGGYNGGSSSMGGINVSNASNPYQKSSSSSGFTFKHILLSLLSLIFIILSGTTFHYRNVMTRTELELNAAKERLEKNMNNRGGGGGGRFDRGRDRPTAGGFENKKQDKKKQKKKTDKKKKKKKNKRDDNDNNNDSLNERKRELQDEIANIKEILADRQREHNEELTTKHSQLSADLEALQLKKQDMLKHIDHTQNIIDDSKEKTAKYKAMVDGVSEVEEYMKKREGALWSRVNVLETKIGKESWREAEEW